MKRFVQVFLFLNLLLWIGACSFTTANFTNLAMASAIDTDNKPIQVTQEFATNTPTIYVTGTIKNAPSNTIIKVEWIYLETDPITLITDYEITVNDVTVNFYFELTKPSQGWPTGRYEARLYIDDVLKETLSFEVK